MVDSVASQLGRVVGAGEVQSQVLVRLVQWELHFERVLLGLLVEQANPSTLLQLKRHRLCEE